MFSFSFLDLGLLAIIWVFFLITSAFIVRHCGIRTAGAITIFLGSFATAQKSNQKKPSLQLRPWETGCLFSLLYYHAAPELAHVEKHMHSDMLAQKAHDNTTD